MFLLILVTLAMSMACLVKCVWPPALLLLCQLSAQRGKPTNTLVGEKR